MKAGDTVGPEPFPLCREDRCFPPEFLRRIAAERLSILPDEIDGSRYVLLSRPCAFADRLHR